MTGKTTNRFASHHLRMAVALSVIALCFSAGETQAARRHIFSSEGEELTAATLRPGAPGGDGHAARAKRARRVRTAPQVAEGIGLKQGDELVISLFDGVAVTSSVDRVSTDVSGTTTIRARMPGSPLGHAIISTHAGRSLGTVLLPEKNMAFTLLRQPGEADHLLLDVSGVDLGALEDAPSPLAPAADESAAAATGAPLSVDAGVADPATITVLVVYTPAARQWADSSGGGINQVIAQTMAKTQLAHDNSQTAITKQLVHSEEVSYTESGSSSTDLSRLQNTSDGYMDNIHTLRNTHLADLVVLMTQVEDVGGIGYLLSSTNGSPAYGFSITRIQQASWTYTTIHEMGHNMGCGHHKLQNYQAGPGLLSYSAGWRWVGADSSRWCSIMTYEEGSYFADGLDHTRVGYFSSPEINYEGVATGHAADGDNRRTLREVKHAVAAYRAIPPANDNFANAEAVTGISGQKTGTNAGATKEAGEPNHAGSAGGRSVWWRWTAPASGSTTVNTFGSAFDTLLAVYTGTQVNSLTLVAANDDSGGLLQSSVTFSASAGTTYNVAVDGFEGGSGNTVLNWVLSPPAPTGVAASDGTYTDKARVTWNSVGPGAYYRVSRGANPGSKTDIGSWQTGTAYDDTSATPGVTYYYWVRTATDAAGANASGYSSSDTGWRALSPPAGFSASDGAYSDRVRATWSSVSGATHYRVYRAASAGGAKTALGSWQTGLSYDDTSATPGVTYHYSAAAAVDNSGSRASAYSTENAGYATAVMRSLEVISTYGGADPEAGLHSYPDGQQLSCRVMTPVVVDGGGSNITAVSAGWTGTGNVPASGPGTNAGPFTITQNSTITWNWIVSGILVSNQTVTGILNLQARDSISAGPYFTMLKPAAVEFRVGPTGTVTLVPPFEAGTGTVFNISIEPAP